MCDSVIAASPRVVLSTPCVTGCLPPRRLPADVRSAVYAVGAQTPRGWDFLLGKYRLHSFHLEKNNIEFALSLTERQDELRW